MYTYANLILDPRADQVESLIVSKHPVIADFNPTQCVLSANQHTTPMVLEQVDVNSNVPFKCSRMGEAVGRYPIILPI